MISEDIEKHKPRQKREVKKRLRLVIATADGGSDNPRKVQDALNSLRGQGIVIEAAGLTESARQTEATYYPNGKCLKSVGEAPKWVAERIISAVQKLYPRKFKSR